MSDRSFSFPHCDFGKGAVCARVEFCHAEDAELATIYADKKPIGVCALSSMGERDVAYCPIDRTVGIHDVTVRVGERAVVHAISFSKMPAYERIDYKPVPEDSLQKIDTDTWEATDMLGRRLPCAEEVGEKSTREVGIFYWTWHQQHASMRPVDVVDVLAKHPEAEFDENHPAWGARPFQCFWHEPLYGFYQNTDPYVIRRHMSLLSHAGVDFLVFDCTNSAFLWRMAYEPLLAEMHRMREEGVSTPKIAFMLNFGPLETTRRMLMALYQNLYAPGLYSDLWYRLDGKPLVMAYPEALPNEGCCASESEVLREIRDFFTFRPGQPGYGCGPSRPDHWGWLEVFPQHKYGERPDGSCEMMTVGVGQNAREGRICTYFNDKDTFGRSYTKKHGFQRLDRDSYKYGYNVQEQWDRAIEIGPDIVFVTGWNEWIMGQHREPWILDPTSTQLAMVDQYDREHSRDIEPDRDGYLDTYYLQLCANIRRFKGASRREATSPPKTIERGGGIAQWADVTPLYTCGAGTTLHRDHDGFLGTHYTNNTGRNDIVAAKVTRDGEFVYFYVACKNDITPPEGSNWMTLLIDTDRDKASGFEGYDLAINRTLPVDGETSVERYMSTNGVEFGWREVGKAWIEWQGRVLTLGVPRVMLGEGASLCFEFKWCDNTGLESAMDFYLNGDTAPIGRFNYLYRE